MAPGGCEGRVQPQSSTKGKFRSNNITEGHVQPQSPLANPKCIAKSKLLILYPITRLNRGGDASIRSHPSSHHDIE